MATRNLGQVSAIHIGVNEPQNKDLIWRDISQSPRLWKIWNSVDAVWEVVPSQTVANNFLNLGDTPVSYAGNGGKILKVKVNLSGIEFADETTYSSEIDIAIEKAILSDSDEFLLSDSGTVKKTKWSQIKSTLKTYFDTLYVSVSTVTNQLISNWNEAFSWGDHSQEGYLKTEVDPVFTAHPASSVVNSGDGTKYLSNDGNYKNLYHNDLLDRDAEDAHPQSAITGLVAKLIELEQSNPVRNVEFLRSTTVSLFGETYYNTTVKEGSGSVLNITVPVTATTQGTANEIAQFASVPVLADEEFTVRQANINVLAYKNATSRVVSIYFELWNMGSSGVLTQLGTSNILTLTEQPLSTELFLALDPNYITSEGDRAILIGRTFQTGTGVAAAATISIDDQTGSRWSFDTVIQADGGGHVILDNEENVMPTQPALQFGAGFTVTDEVDKTVVERDVIDYADIIPDPTKGKKLAKVKDDGTGLDYTDYGYDEVVQKAQTFNEGTLKKFDVNGNDVDSGLTGESLDIYAVSHSLINALTNESNWRDGGGNPIVGGVAFASGIKGQRYYSDEFFYECIADNSWVRTYTGRSVINIYDNPALTLVFKGYLENTVNWVGKIYVGTAITGVAQGTRHYDNDYVYEFFQTNVPIRYSRN